MTVFVWIIVYIMMEYLSKGSLHNLLHVCKDALGTLQLIMFARDIACGMEYLATEKVELPSVFPFNLL